MLARYGNVDAHALRTTQQVIEPEALAAAQAEVAADSCRPGARPATWSTSLPLREPCPCGLGLSTRGVLALLRAARIAAGMRGGEFVTPDDVKQVAPLVIPHRLVLAPMRCWKA